MEWPENMVTLSRQSCCMPSSEKGPWDSIDGPLLRGYRPVILRLFEVVEDRSPSPAWVTLNKNNKTLLGCLINRTFTELLIME